MAPARYQLIIAPQLFILSPELIDHLHTATSHFLTTRHFNVITILSGAEFSTAGGASLLLITVTVSSSLTLSAANYTEFNKLLQKYTRRPLCLICPAGVLPAKHIFPIWVPG